MKAGSSSRKAGENLLACFALKEEAAPFRKIAAGKSGVDILLTGVGRRNAEKSVREFLTTNLPDLVLTCGFAGGLNPELKLGDVLFEIGNRKSEIGNQIVAAGAKPAKFFCADRVAISIADKKKLRAETGADAVEMESEAIRTVCRECGIQCATVRVISDTAHEDLPLDFNVLAKPDKSLDYGKLILAVAKSPGKTRGLLRLQKNCRFAAERLAGVLMKIILL